METNKIKFTLSNTKCCFKYSDTQFSWNKQCIYSFWKYLLHLASKTQFIKCWNIFLENKQIWLFREWWQAFIPLPLPFFICFSDGQKYTEKTRLISWIFQIRNTTLNEHTLQATELRIWPWNFKSIFSLLSYSLQNAITVYTATCCLNILAYRIRLLHDFLNISPRCKFFLSIQNTNAVT